LNENDDDVTSQRENVDLELRTSMPTDMNEEVGNTDVNLIEEEAAKHERLKAGQQTPPGVDQTTGPPNGTTHVPLQMSSNHEETDSSGTTADHISKALSMDIDQ
jgi:hypothetical protein